MGGWSEGDENIYYVKDNGSGFDPRYADKLFVPSNGCIAARNMKAPGWAYPSSNVLSTDTGVASGLRGKRTRGATFYFALPQKEG